MLVNAASNSPGIRWKRFMEPGIELARSFPQRGTRYAESTNTHKVRFVKLVLGTVMMCRMRATQ